MMMKARWTLGLVGGALATWVASAQAILVPAAGPGTGLGRIEHAFWNTAPGGGPADFDGHFDGTTGGFMHAPGFFFPTLLGGGIAENDTGPFGMAANVPYSLVTPAGALNPGFGGASTTITGVAGAGRAGVSASNLAVADLAPLGQASTNAAGALVQYVNVGGPVVGRYAHFLAGTGVSPVGGYVAAGVKSIIEVDLLGRTGAAFVPMLFWEPLPIIMAFDGVGVGLADAIQADFFMFSTLGPTLSFAAISASPVLTIPAGASVQIRGTITLIADPLADLQLSTMDPGVLSNVSDMFLGIGGSTDGDTILPEPATAGLLVTGILMLASRRRSRI